MSYYNLLMFYYLLQKLMFVAVIAETEEELIKRLNEWKENVESKCMRVHMNKTKIMISGERQMVWQKAA